MKKFLLLPVLLLALSPLSLQASAPEVPVADLVPSADQVRATALITRIIEKHHYRPQPLDDHLSAEIFKRYLKSLDPNKSYFTAQDVAALDHYRTTLDDALREARLQPAFEIFRLFRRRAEERGAYAASLLKRQFDFTRDEDYVFNRSDLDWAKDQKALDDVWRKRVKNDVLSLRLAGRTHAQIVDTLGKRYERLGRSVAQLNAEDVYQLFMNAYTESIEPHTAYFSPRTSENFRIRLSLSLEGIGAALQTENEFTVVRRIIAGGPAEKGGELHVEDRITGVGQGTGQPMVDVVGWRLDDVVDLIRGPKDSVVRLEILPKGASATGAHKVITLVRNKIELAEQAAKKSLIEVPEGAEKMRIGVIDVPTFYLDAAGRARGDKDYRSTTRDVRRLLSELVKEGVDGVVIDLRGDGGGSLTEAIDLTGLFIKSGPIVQVKDSTVRVQVYRDPDPGIAYGGPMAVLVDRYSASASEIFSGAIQDYGRGIVIGEPTYGKGTVQSLLDLDRFTRDPDTDLGQLKATIAQFFRVSGGSTQHRGVVPDIVYPTALNSTKYGERMLDNALPWASVRPAAFKVAGDPQMVLPQVKARHDERMRSDPAFPILLDEMRALKQAREQTSTSLVETRRRSEQKVLEKAERDRQNKLRASRGMEPLRKDADKAAADATGADDPHEGEGGKDLGAQIWLDEAAHILSDWIDLSRRPPALLKTAVKEAVVPRCALGDC